MEANCRRAVPYARIKVRVTKQMEIIVKVREQPLPTELLLSEDFSSLNEPQKRNFLSRIRHIQEIPLKIDEGFADSDPDLAGIIDRLELDVSVCLSTIGDSPENAVSTWRMHSIWLAEYSVSELRESVSSVLSRTLAATQFPVDTTKENFRTWLFQCRDALSESLHIFFGAQQMKTACAALLVIDANLAALWRGLMLARLCWAP
jgi:hypothetical protein